MNAMQAGRRAEDDARTAEPARRAHAGAPPTEHKPPAGRRPAIEPPAPRPPAAERTAAMAPAAERGAATPPAPGPKTATPTKPGPTAAKPADTRRRALGRYGEDLAARRLIEAGMRILDRNWRCRDGEIDIVAADGDALVVCEVKTRRAGWYEHPMAAVRPEKTARLRLLAERWLERHGGPPPGGVRIDVIGVLLPARGAPVVQHARGVA
ncbi:YraN family protein [Streptomyces sp. NBC_00400]